MHWTSNTWNNDSLLQFSFQGCDISPLLENNNPREGFQIGCSEERAGESHQEDGKVVTLDTNSSAGQLQVLGLASRENTGKTAYFSDF